MDARLLKEMTCVGTFIRCEWCEHRAEFKNLCAPCHADFLAAEQEGVELTAADFELERSIRGRGGRW